ncbi:MAG: dual specificity protein phosphatase family protein [Phenylobacterium sp.]|nr:dual specificity protein phosphatase family protein [Phenylobacterium sp.]
MISSPKFSICEIDCGRSALIGLAACPGKPEVAPHLPVGYLLRDLQSDLETVQAWGAEAVVTLLLDEEIAELGVLEIGASVRRLGMSWLHLPINDGSAPTPEWDQEWVEAKKRIHCALDRGRRVLLHCEAGRGRSGTVAARILMERGMHAGIAIDTVRARRAGAINEPRQADYLFALTPNFPSFPLIKMVAPG